MTNQKSKGKFKLKLIKEIKSILIAVAIAFAIRTFICQLFIIPSGSMMPDLENGDYIIASKFSYGITKHSLPLSFLPLPNMIYNKPERGEVIIFRYPGNNKDYYIKRVVGLPGDTIEIKNDAVIVNGKEYVKFDTGENGEVQSYDVHLKVETTSSNKSYNIYETDNPLLSSNFGPVTVPDGKYFAMGDNRHFSRDSRYSDVGFIPEENIIAKPLLILFSIPGGRFFQVWDWKSKARWDKVFNIIK